MKNETHYFGKDVLMKPYDKNKGKAEGKEKWVRPKLEPIDLAKNTRGGVPASGEGAFQAPVS